MPNFPHNDFLPTASVVAVVGSKSGTNRREVFSRYLHSKGKEKRAISWQNILWILIIVAMTTTREGKKEIPHSWPSYLCTNDSIWLLLLCSSMEALKKIELRFHNHSDREFRIGSGYPTCLLHSHVP